MFGLGLPAGSEAAWPATVPFWDAAVAAAQALVDPSYRRTPQGAEYELALGPAEVRDRADSLTPEGALAVPTIVLQGEQDVIALPAWAGAYEARVLAADRAAGLRMFVFPGAGHTLAAAGEDTSFVQARLRRGWETLTGWVESGAEPRLILGVQSTLAAVRGGAPAR